MTLYLFDSDASPGSKQCRDWGSLLPKFALLRYDDLLGRFTEGVKAGEKGLVVVHQSSIGGAKCIDAVKKLGVPILVISGDPELERKPVPGLEPEAKSCYYRSAAVRGRKELDTTFRDLFDDFWTIYTTTGELKWAILEPERWPRNLVILYLVVRSAELSQGEARGKILAGWKAFDNETKRKIWQTALEEHMRRGGSYDKWKFAGLPDVSKPGEDEVLDFGEEKIAEALNTLASVFVPVNTKCTGVGGKS